MFATRPNPCAAEYRRSGVWPDLGLSDLFARTVERCADRLALIDRPRLLTFRQLETLAASLAGGLRALGLGPGDVVAYQLPNWWEAAVVFLAAARSGATATPLPSAFRERELRFTLSQTRARALFIPGVHRDVDHRRLIAAVRAQLPALEHLVVVRDEAEAGMLRFNDLLAAGARGGEGDGVQVDPDGAVLVMYTSGTTAEPKGVLHTHNTLAAEVMSLQRVHGLSPADRNLMPSPLAHVSGLIHAILAPALLGTSAVLMERWNAQQALERISSEAVTYMVGAPTFLQEMLESAAHMGSAPEVGWLRLFSCGGADVSPELLRRARQQFPGCVAKRVYGSTEFPTATTTDAEDALSHGIETEGRAIAPTEVRIACPVGVEGEVQARGPECFVGYLDPALNDEAFTADGWFRTGDLGVLDGRGYLRITGRIKEIIIRKGEKISVKEVEDAIAAHPAVAEVAVLAMADAKGGERACAVIRPRPGQVLDLADLTHFLASEGLAKQKWPEDLRIVADFPRTESGKIQRMRLKAWLRQPRE